MARRIASSSLLPLVRHCPACMVLPHDRSFNRDSKMGDALHHHMQERARLGVDSAMANLHATALRYELGDKEGIFVARCRGFEWCPPKGALAELGLCLREDGSALRVKGGKGVYEMPEDGVVAGTLDVAWSEPAPLDWSDPEHPRCPPGSVLWVCDYKTGEEVHVDPIEYNAQAKTNALLAARFTGAEVAVPAIVFLRKGKGEWDVPDRAMSARDLALHEGYVRAWQAEAARQQALAEAGESVQFVEGPHCTFCPGRARCSAHTGILKAIITGPAPIGDAPLSEHERAWLAGRLPSIERLAKRARQVLIDDVGARGPIDLGDGNVWGPYPHAKTTIVPKEAIGVLLEELGDRGTQQAIRVETSVTRESVEEVVRERHAEQGIQRQLAPTMRRIFAKLGEAGALLSTEETWYGPHKPQRSLEEQLEASLEEAHARHTA